jgi:broad specificity phosphatase PhoE
MKPVRLVLPMLALLLAACASVPPPEPAPAFYVMRHLQTPEGERDPDLTEEGRRLAMLLATGFGRNAPRAAYVTQWKRTQQSAAPLAARLRLVPVVYDAGATDDLAARVRAEAGPVLIVGHSNTVPDIVERLGGERPAALTHHDFGDLWIVHPDGRTERRAIAPR